MNILKNLLGFGCMGAGILMPSLLARNANPDLALVAFLGGYVLFFALILLGACICAIRIR